MQLPKGQAAAAAVCASNAVQPLRLVDHELYALHRKESTQVHQNSKQIRWLSFLEDNRCTALSASSFSFSCYYSSPMVRKGRRRFADSTRPQRRRSGNLATRLLSALSKMGKIRLKVSAANSKKSSFRKVPDSGRAL